MPLLRPQLIPRNYSLLSSLAPLVTQKVQSPTSFLSLSFVSHYFHFKYHLNSAITVLSLNWEYSGFLKSVQYV